MKIETIGALLFRALGVAVFLLGIYSGLRMAILYFSFLNSNVLQDSYFVVGESIIWVGLLFIGGALFVIFSKALGRLIAKGLQ